MTVDVARRTRRRAATKGAAADASGADSDATAPAVRPRRGAATKPLATEPAPTLPDPVEPVMPALAVGLRMPNPTPAAPPSPAIAPSASFRSASSFAPPPASAPAASFAPAASLAIGELDQTIFDCPSCSRPLALGARRCPGCKTRLLNGVVLTKAAGFAAVGLALGLLAGAGGGFLLGSGRAAAGVAAVAAGPSASPSSAASVTPTQAPTVAPSLPAATPGSDVPAWTTSAFRQVLDMNGRFATAAGDLRAALKAPVFDPSAVAQTLRTISADSVFAQQLADRVAAWPGSGAVGPQLVDFYGQIHETASNGLVASVRNASAYHEAATAMLALIDQEAAIDTAVRAQAAAVGIDVGGAPAAP